MSIIVVVVGDKEIMNIIGTFFNNCKKFGFLECLDSHLNDILEMVLMVDWSDFLLLKIDDINMCSRNIKNDNLLLIDHLKIVNHMLILMLKEEFAICIHVNDTLIFSRENHMWKNESIAISYSRAKNFRNPFFKCDHLLLP